MSKEIFRLTYMGFAVFGILVAAALLGLGIYNILDAMDNHRVQEIVAEFMNNKTLLNEVLNKSGS